MKSDRNQREIQSINHKPGNAVVKTRIETILLEMREMILNGELAPGVRIHEVALAKRLNCSRTPVRISLSILEQEGLVHGQPNRGFTVRQFTIKEVLDAFSVRSALEGFACRIIAQNGLTFESERELDECIETGDQLLAVGHLSPEKVRDWSELNGRFHNALVLAAQNTPLAGAIQHINRYPLTAPNSIGFGTHNLERFFSHMQQSQREHANIVDALKKRESDRAVALMMEHVYQSTEVIGKELKMQGKALSTALRVAWSKATHG